MRYGLIGQLEKSPPSTSSHVDTKLLCKNEANNANILQMFYQSTSLSRSEIGSFFVYICNVA